MADEKKDEKKTYICINDGDRRCLKYDKCMFMLLIVKTILTPKMVVSIGFIIMMIMSMKG